VLISYVPVSDLIEAARSFHVRPDDSKARESLSRALNGVAQAERERDSYRDAIAEARECYADDDCEIDDEPVVSIGDDGVWVNAWVWVPRPSEPEFDQDGEAH